MGCCVPTFSWQGSSTYSTCSTIWNERLCGMKAEGAPVTWPTRYIAGTIVRCWNLKPCIVSTKVFFVAYPSYHAGNK